MTLKRSLVLILTVVTLIASGCAGRQDSGSVAPKQILVSAAISLKDAFTDIKAEFEKNNKDINVNYNFGASGTLQIQIEQGAAVDVFASAGETQMDALENKGLLVPGTRRDFAGNTAVLVVPKTGGLPLTSFSDLTKPEVKRIAIGNPNSVPAGAYAKQILQSIGIWDSVQSKIVLAENVRQVLTYVEEGNVEAGIVYGTDAASSDKVRVVAKAPEGSSQPILYPIAVISTSKSVQEGKAFVDFVAGPQGQAILAKYGFLPARQSESTPRNSGDRSR